PCCTSGSTPGCRPRCGGSSTAAERAETEPTSPTAIRDGGGAQGESAPRRGVAYHRDEKAPAGKDRRGPERSPPTPRRVTRPPRGAAPGLPRPRARTPPPPPSAPARTHQP